MILNSGRSRMVNFPSKFHSKLRIVSSVHGVAGPYVRTRRRGPAAVVSLGKMRDGMRGC